MRFAQKSVVAVADSADSGKQQSSAEQWADESADTESAAAAAAADAESAAAAVLPEVEFVWDEFGVGVLESV